MRDGGDQEAFGELGTGYDGFQITHHVVRITSYSSHAIDVRRPRP